MADMDEPLDFENEDPLLATPLPDTKRRKIIGLDDLLNDLKEQSTVVKKKSKKVTMLKGYNSDEEDDKTRILSKVVNECQTQVNKMCTEDDVPLWGQRIFGHQKSLPPFNSKELVNCDLLQLAKRNELNSSFGLNLEDGESLMEGLLMNGWLSQLAFTCGFMEDCVTSWTFFTSLYSSNNELQVSACDFWCNVLLSKDEADQPLVRLGWFPTYSQFKDALEVYGYLCEKVDSLVSNDVISEPGCDGPPENIWSWVNVLSACCRLRGVKAIISPSEAADLLSVIISLFLDRQLLGLSVALNECMESIIGFFSDSEWDASCKKVAQSVAFRTPKDLNCVRIVECISGTNRRSKNLRSEVAFQTLLLCFKGKVTDGKEILKILMAMNVKDKNCDFLKLYVRLVMVENWLSFCRLEEQKDVLLDLWYRCLRNCSSQITSTDWRSYASKVRNKASYLLQKTVH